MAAIEPHVFEVHEAKHEKRPGEWCKHCNTGRDEVPGLHLQTPEEWLRDHFSHQGCDECGAGAEAHEAILFMGNWFARCKG